MILKSSHVTLQTLEYLELSEFNSDTTIYLYLTDTLLYKIRKIDQFYEASEHEILNNTYYLSSIYTKSDINLFRLITDLIN